MQERLPLEHGSELLANTAEQFLNGSWISEERNSHLEVRLLLDAIDWFVVVIIESATDTRTDSLPRGGDSPAQEAIGERSDGRECIGAGEGLAEPRHSR